MWGSNVILDTVNIKNVTTNPLCVVQYHDAPTELLKSYMQMNKDICEASPICARTEKKCIEEIL